HSEKVRAVLPPDIFPINEPHVGFIDQLCSLQSVARAFATHVVSGQSMQLLINEWHQLIKSFLVAITPGLEQLRDFMRRGFGHRNPTPACKLSCKRLGLYHSIPNSWIAD